MKKIIFAVIVLLAGIFTAKADGNERPISVEALPKAAQEFIMLHFGQMTPTYVVEEAKYSGKEYEVYFSDRTEVEFAADGRWRKVERKYAPVPEAIVPEEIRTFVAGQGNTYPGLFVREIERTPYTWEIEMSNGIEVKFDRKFNVIGYDD